MYSVEQRSPLLAALIDAARVDGSIVAAATVGSAARHETDRWSDIDLALGLAAGADLPVAVERWSRLLHELAAVADHLDVEADGARYRVFLLADSLQVDLSFWPDGSFRSTGGPFELLFGVPGEPDEPVPVEALPLLRWGWLHALHARAALQRERPWQALQMIDGLRDRLIELACLRHGIPPFQGRGVDHLPADELDRLRAVVAVGVGQESLRTAFTAGLVLLGGEAEMLDPRRHEALAPAIAALLER